MMQVVSLHSVISDLFRPSQIEGSNQTAHLCSAHALIQILGGGARCFYNNTGVDEQELKKKRA